MTELGGGASRTTDPAAGTSAATDVSLREHLTALIAAAEARSDARFDAMQKAVEEAFTGAQKAIDKAETATEKRLEGMNEFRSQLADQAATFVNRDVLDALTSKLELQIDRNRDDLDLLAKRIDMREGSAAGAKITLANLVTIIVVAVAIIGTIIGLANYFAAH